MRVWLTDLHAWRVVILFALFQGVSMHRVIAASLFTFVLALGGASAATVHSGTHANLAGYCDAGCGGW
jgi:hypothetical protein